MSRKDYEMIAAVIRRWVEVDHDGILNDVASDLANNLKLDNPRFDRERFLAACGVIKETN